MSLLYRIPLPDVIVRWRGPGVHKLFVVCQEEVADGGRCEARDAVEEAGIVTLALLCRPELVEGVVSVAHDGVWLEVRAAWIDGPAIHPARSAHPAQRPADLVILRAVDARAVQRRRWIGRFGAVRKAEHKHGPE